MKKKSRMISQLQDKILLHVSKTKNPNFSTLESEISNRSRKTLEQSISSLIEKKLMYRTELRRGKIRIFFKPTIKGVLYSIGFLGIKVGDLKNRPHNIEQLQDYESYIKETAKEELIDALAISFSQNLINMDFFDDDGNLKTTNPFSLNEQFLRVMLLNDLQNNNFEIKELFRYNKLGLDILKENCNQSGLIPLKSILRTIKINLEESVKKLSD